MLGCFLKTFTDIIDIGVFLSLLYYVFTFLFNMYRILFTLFHHVEQVVTRLRFVNHY